MKVKDIVHSLLFATDKALSAADLVKAIKRAQEQNQLPLDEQIDQASVQQAIQQLDVELSEGAIQLIEINKGYRLSTRPDFQPWVSGLVESKSRVSKLSQPALETLAIIAYRQPISRAEIEAVRGVAVGGVMETLGDRGLVHVAGRADIPGRPLLYETTPLFLEHFGLSDLNALPNVEELRRVPLPEPPEHNAPQQEELMDTATAPEATSE
ncbi:MAG: SMC-Scp complex subunit ScpB [Verrucomicrobiota bacterium]